MSNLLLAYYGDDFTGSTDVLESLTYGGVKTVLFLDPPTPAILADYPGLRAFGIAGNSRTMSPETMQESLPDIFSNLAASGANIVHYKTCSTFDSSPSVGSIGKAIDIGRQVVASSFTPLVVGAPVLGRYCAFGNLFARSGLDTAPYRLDRHPTMRQHPVTPMDEADLRLILASQTEQRVDLIDCSILDASKTKMDTAFADLLENQPEIVLFDTMTDAHLDHIGRLIWNHRPASRPMFVAGSSGVEYALAAHWKEVELVGEAEPLVGGAAVKQLVVVSGSCSPVTDRQIAWACRHGFAELALDTCKLVDPASRSDEIERSLADASAVLSEGKSVVLHTCRGPEDSRRSETTQRCQELSLDNPSETLGRALGEILRRIVQQQPLARVAVTGGDTSGYVARELGITALEIVGPLAPGSPLCRVRSPIARIAGCEITFKGGQVGKEDFFGTVLSGKP